MLLLTLSSLFLLLGRTRIRYLSSRQVYHLSTTKMSFPYISKYRSHVISANSISINKIIDKVTWIQVLVILYYRLVSRLKKAFNAAIIQFYFSLRNKLLNLNNKTTSFKYTIIFILIILSVSKSKSVVNIYFLSRLLKCYEFVKRQWQESDPVSRLAIGAASFLRPTLSI